MKRSKGFVNVCVHMVVPAIILAVAWYTMSYINQNKPQAPRRSTAAAAPALAVEAITVQPQAYQLTVKTYGTVEPRVRGTIVSQVSGATTVVNPVFADGGRFEEGQLLLEIDARDYQAAVTIAQSELQEARAVLEEERVRASRARADLERLGKTAQATSLALREPQLKAAQARVDSAKANLMLRRLDVERTQIRAPYPGRIVTRHVGKGQYVNQGTVLADVYATDAFEVKAPISQVQLHLLGLTELIEQPDAYPQLSQVTINDDTLRGEGWNGRITRYDSQLSSSRQLNLIVQMNPDDQSKKAAPLRVGQFVAVTIVGQRLDSVFVVPRQSLYEDAFVLSVDGGNLQKKPVNVVWQEEEHIVISSGLSAGDQVVTSPLSDPIPGTSARVIAASDNKPNHTVSASAVNPQDQTSSKQEAMP